jgi:hypothetical protein
VAAVARMPDSPFDHDLAQVGAGGGDERDPGGGVSLARWVTSLPVRVFPEPRPPSAARPARRRTSRGVAGRRGRAASPSCRGGVRRSPCVHSRRVAIRSRCGSAAGPGPWLGCRGSRPCRRRGLGRGCRRGCSWPVTGVGCRPPAPDGAWRSRPRTSSRPSRRSRWSRARARCGSLLRTTARNGLDPQIKSIHLTHRTSSSVFAGPMRTILAGSKAIPWRIRS